MFACWSRLSSLPLLFPCLQVDAAARVLDPVIGPLTALERGEVGVEPPWGVFLKDYMKCEW